MTTQYNFYKVEKKAPIAWVFLNRPEKKNAMGPDAWKEIIPIFADIDADESTRVAIIAGEGKDLSTGIDIMGMAPMIPTMKNWDMSAKGKVRLFKDIFPLQDAMTSVEKCSKPVICCFHGYSIGAALDLGSACDIRLASEDARISLREAAVSFIADVGVLQRLPHIVGQGITREMAFTAKFIDAKRAREVNLVNEVYPDKDALLKGAEARARDASARRWRQAGGPQLLPRPGIADGSSTWLRAAPWSSRPRTSRDHNGLHGKEKPVYKNQTPPADTARS